VGHEKKARQTAAALSLGYVSGVMLVALPSGAGEHPNEAASMRREVENVRMEFLSMGEACVVQRAAAI
jgi:hypothetical protein